MGRRAPAPTIVSGGTGAGKTTLLNALGALLPDDERIVTVEDTAELRLPGAHVVRLEARPATADGLGATTIRQLVRNALRMRPDRIIVGEVRGPEAVDMLWAMNTGHEGSLSTCHANSPVDALRRLEVMVLSAGLDLPMAAVRDQLSSVARPRRPGRPHATAARARSSSVAEVIDPAEPDGPRVRLLAGPTGLHDLPARAPASAGHPAARPGLVHVTRALAGARGRRPRPRRASARPRAPTRPTAAPTAAGPTRRRGSPRCSIAAPPSARRTRDRQLPDALDRLGSACGPERPSGPALVGLARDVADPLGTELGGLARSVEHGPPVADALAAWAASSDASRRRAAGGRRPHASAPARRRGRPGRRRRRRDPARAPRARGPRCARWPPRPVPRPRCSPARPLAFALLVATVEPARHRLPAHHPSRPRVPGRWASGSTSSACVWMARITRSAG